MDLLLQAHKILQARQRDERSRPVATPSHSGASRKRVFDAGFPETPSSRKYIRGESLTTKRRDQTRQRVQSFKSDPSKENLRTILKDHDLTLDQMASLLCTYIFHSTSKRVTESSIKKTLSQESRAVKNIKEKRQYIKNSILRAIPQQN